MTDTWRNRIVGHGEESPEQLLANPLNWRTHPEHQQKALDGVLSEVGWVQEVIVNQRTGHLIDGHLRVALAMRRNEPTIPVLYVDLSEEEERLILATLDPLAAMAETNAEIITQLIEEIDKSGMLDDLLWMLNGVCPESDSAEKLPDPEDVWKDMGMPPFEQEDAFDPAHTIKVHFQSKEAIEEFSQLIGQSVTEKTRYIWYPPKPPENLKRYQVDVNDE